MVPSVDEVDDVLTDRYTFLSAIIEQPQSKRDLEGEVDCSRSTLDRAIRDLSNAGLVEYENGLWMPTLFGQCCYDARETFYETLGGLVSASSLIESLDSDDSVSREFFTGANPEESDPMMPDAIMQQLLNCVEHATQVRIATPVILTGYAEELYTAALSGDDASLELIVPPMMFERLEERVPTVVTEMLCDPNVTLQQATIPIDFGLWTIDSEKTGILVFTDQGIRGFITNDTDAAVEWATNKYEQLEQNADPISPVEGIR